MANGSQSCIATAPQIVPINYINMGAVGIILTKTR